MEWMRALEEHLKLFSKCIAAVPTDINKATRCRGCAENLLIRATRPLAQASSMVSSKQHHFAEWPIKVKCDE